MLITAVALSTLALPAQGKEILIVAGPSSHGWNEHEFPAGAEALADALNDAPLEINAHVSVGWPSDAANLKNLDALVLYSDGLDKHVAKGQHDTLRKLYQNGTGLAVLHFALEPGDPELEAVFAESIGGYFEVNWSVNPVWTLEAPLFGDHTILTGVDPFSIEDEWYYHLRFQETDSIKPVLSARPPVKTLGKDGPRSGNPAVRAALQDGVPQILAWTKTSPSGQRGFGFTGGHYLHNLNEDAFRTLILNGIAWTAGIQIPDTGIISDSPEFVRYQYLSHAIARDDIEDIERHLKNDPALINQAGTSKLTPLNEAILRKKSEAALLLIERGADVNQPDRSGNAPLHNAISRKLTEVAPALIESGADPDARDKNGWTTLHLAAAKDAVDIARLLIESDADIHILSTAGGTPLHEAAVSASAEMVTLLLEAGVDPSVVSQHGVTALDIAKEYQNAAAIELLEAQ